MNGDRHARLPLLSSAASSPTGLLISMAFATGAGESRSVNCFVSGDAGRRAGLTRPVVCSTDG